jgi:hypothetical protein
VGFPVYWVRWVARRPRGERSRLGVAMVALAAWGAATVVCFLVPMIGCLGGGCAGRVWPFLPLAAGYAAISIALALVMRRHRAPGAG